MNNLTDEEEKDIKQLLDMLNKITAPPWRWGGWDVEFGNIESKNILDRRYLESSPYPDNKPIIRKSDEPLRDLILNVEDPLQNKADAELICIAPRAIGWLIQLVQRLNLEYENDEKET